jgi:hypothetical protein
MAAELCEVGPTPKRPYDHKLVLDRIKARVGVTAAKLPLGGLGGLLFCNSPCTALLFAWIAVRQPRHGASANSSTARW